MKRATGRDFWKLAAAASLLVAGCSSSGGGGSSNSNTTKPTVALVMKSLANEFFQTMEKGAVKDQANRPNDYTLVSTGIKDEEDVAGQQRMVEDMISRGVNAIVIAPADSKALIPVCEKAMKAGIAVVNIDNRLDADILKQRNLQIPFVGPDNEKGAKEVGEVLAKKLKAGDPVAVIEGAPNALNGTQRKQGFMDAMAECKANVVASETGEWETDKANKVAAAMLTAHPDLKALLCANDNMALGAVAAIKEAGKQSQVLVVGFDNISAVQQLIKQGQVLATADQHADQLAVYGIQYALDILNKKAQPVDKETPVDLITVSSLK